MEKGSKTIIRPSDFWKDVISYAILIPILIFIITQWHPSMADIGSAARFGAIMVVGMFIFFRMAITHMCLDVSINFIYRIKKIHNGVFKAKVCRSWFWIIPYWAAINESHHTYKTQNLFGRKETGVYSTEVIYPNIESAREAVSTYKKKAKEQRIAYFAKKKIEKFKTIKI